MHIIISLKYAVGLLVVLYSQIYAYMSKASSLAPNEGRNNWCHFEQRDFDFEIFETFLDFFRLRDQKTSGAKARWHSLEGRPCGVESDF